MGGSKEQIEAELKAEGDKEMTALTYVRTPHWKKYIAYMRIGTC